MIEFKANKDKKLEIQVDGSKYLRIPIKTHIIKSGDDLKEVIESNAGELLQEGDYIFISEKIVAISQGRSFPIKDIHPSKMAILLSKYVLKTPYGIGIGSPHTMELAIRDVGWPRIILGIVVAVLTKPFGIRGMFYRVCGPRARAIDGPCDYTLPPYNKYAKMAPENPNKVARELASVFNNEVVIIDANDLGVNVLGKSSRDVSNKFCEQVFRDNPLGQTNEQTPVCIVRQIKNNK